MSVLQCTNEKHHTVKLSFVSYIEEIRFLNKQQTYKNVYKYFPQASQLTSQPHKTLSALGLVQSNVATSLVRVGAHLLL